MGYLSLNFAPILLTAISLCFTGNSDAAASSPALLVFGDSLVDSGNNDYIPSIARADMPPYGIDFPTHQPTGRFSNGKNVPDIICERLGIPRLRPYLDPEFRGLSMLNGANFASAGVGILNDTGAIFMAVIGIQQQFEYFREYQRRIAAIIGVPATRNLVSEALVSVTLGGNDYVNNYFLPMSARAQQLNLTDYTQLLVSEFKKQLTTLYELGARRIMVSSVGPLGCVPSVLSRSPNGSCDQDLENAATEFDKQVEVKLEELRTQFPSAKFLFASAFHGHSEFMTNPKAFGFENNKKACCGQGSFNGQGLCTPFSNLCPNRSTHLFWDAFHPTERACGFIVDGFFNGSAKHIRPINLTTLLGLSY
eukprot:PITA_18766